MDKKSQGFTLIELLTVVAIIGLLATIVTAVVYNAKSKSKDARVKTALTQVRNVAAIIFTGKGSYTDMCRNADGGEDVNGNVYGTFLNGADETSNHGLKTVKDEVKNMGVSEPSCFATDSEFCVQATLPSGGNYCVDSTGSAADSGNCAVFNVKCAAQ